MWCSLFWLIVLSKSCIENLLPKRQVICNWIPCCQPQNVLQESIVGVQLMNDVFCVCLYNLFSNELRMQLLYIADH